LSRPQDSLFDRARRVLETAAPHAKCAAARATAADWRAGALSLEPAPPPPDRPARPARPELRPPGDVPRRRLGGQAGRVALLHALAHIEFNAVDLAFDMVARFGSGLDLPDGERRAFLDDWVAVGDDEARHFTMISDRLAALGAAYGDLPAHDGLWDAARSTADDVLARLAIAPMVLEARGLDVTPGMAERLRRNGDEASALILDTIYAEEIGHVAAGARWFERLCAGRGVESRTAFHELVGANFAGRLKPPFNEEARARAGLSPDLYLPLSG